MQPEQENWQQPTPATNEFHPEVTPPTPQPDSPAQAPLPDSQAGSTNSPREGEEQAVRWQASEYIYREKNPLWYTIFGVITIVLM